MRDNILYPNLLAELARNGASVRDLAEAIGMTNQNLYSKLRGNTSVNEKDMREIQKYFKDINGGYFSIDYLFSNEPIINERY